MSFPWEDNEASLSWEITQGLYDRVISIHRPIIPNSVGTVGYQGLLPSKEVVLFTNLPATIQYQLRRDIPLPHLPADAFSVPLWHMWIPLGYIVDGDVTERDIVVDDLARRFQLFGAWPNTLGQMLAGELLQA